MIIGASAASVFAILFAVFCSGFIFQFKEFASVGLSPENLLESNYIPFSEATKFIQYHMLKTAGILIIHSFLPLLFFVGFGYSSINLDHSYESLAHILESYPYSQILLTISIMIPLITIITVNYWSKDNWSKHPFTSKILPYANNGQVWTNIISDLNVEFRRIDKFTIQTSPITKIVVTDNWIIMVGQWPWNFHLAHQSDVSISLSDSNHHNISPDGQAGGSQYLIIDIKNSGPNKDNFQFRLNSLEYQNLTDKLRSPIENIKNIMIFKTVSERFLEVFSQEVKLNPKASVDRDLDHCIGCMIQSANVTLVRRCETQDSGDEDACVTCYCRPMWCIDCLGKWFASRQNQQVTDNWLSSKCPCPTCRSKFCILDVSLIDNPRNN